VFSVKYFLIAATDLIILISGDIFVAHLWETWVCIAPEKYDVLSEGREEKYYILEFVHW